jgi:hypothetical protein
MAGWPAESCSNQHAGCCNLQQGPLQPSIVQVPLAGSMPFCSRPSKSSLPLCQRLHFCEAGPAARRPPWQGGRLLTARPPQGFKAFPGSAPKASRKIPRPTRVLWPSQQPPPPTHPPKTRPIRPKARALPLTVSLFCFTVIFLPFCLGPPTPTRTHQNRSTASAALLC